MERGLVIGNTLFRKKDINKYTWVRVERGIVTDRAMMDYVIVSKDMRHKLVDVHVFRGAAGGVSDHYLVQGLIKVDRWWRRRRGVCVKRRIKVKELEKIEKEVQYQELISARWERVRSLRMREVEEEWKDLKEGALEEGGREECVSRDVV